MVAMPRPDTLQADEALDNRTTEQRRRRPVTLRRAALAAALLAGVGAASYFGHQYWTVGRFQIATDDAYVKADYTTIAPKVAGYIAEVRVTDNQPVRAGQVLARIDDRDYRAAFNQAKADVDAAEAAIRNFDARISLQLAQIDQAKATIAATQASLQFAEADAGRYQSLVKTGAGTLQRAQQTQSTLLQATAQLRRDQAALTAAEREIDVLTTARRQAEAQAEHSRAVQQQAELNLGYTQIVAPVDGTVGSRALRVGQYVTAGTKLMAVVPLNAAYIVANYKETQLVGVHPGQTVAISVDGLGGHTLKGHVDSIAPASGLEFALLPPDNATGNFTKIVQRIPVKIVLDDPTAVRLRAGMSVEPSIDTRTAAVN
ncbi:MAG: HlyD family secretion protein [Acetobacteraceae bacterium]